MATKDPAVKHLQMPCMNSIGDEQCPAKAFVQVVIVDDPATQKKIDARANKKLSDTLAADHKEGLHNG